MEELAGEIVMEAKVPALTVNVAVAVFVASVPVTVCAPEVVAVQVAPAQDPLGPIEKVVAPVTFPSELLFESNPVAVYVWLPPEVIEAEAGAIVM
jgi:hypothetical protein